VMRSDQRVKLVACRMSGIVYFRKLPLKPLMRNSVLEELRVRRFADIQEEVCLRAVWRWAILESKLRGWNEKKLSIKIPHYHIIRR